MVEKKDAGAKGARASKAAPKRARKKAAPKRAPAKVKARVAPKRKPARAQPKPKPKAAPKKRKAAGRGRPTHVPTPQNRQLVELLAGFGIPEPNISQVVNVPRTTLRKYYAAELRNGAATVEAKLVNNLLRIANGVDGTALKAIIFSLRCRFGWSEYLPRAAVPDEPGKKEAANLEAQYAHRDSDWSELVH